MNRPNDSSLGGLALVFLLGCSSETGDCHRTYTCEVPNGGAGAAGSDVGSSTKAGKSSVGGESGGGGATSAGGTTSTTAPCNGSCSGSTPVCNETSNRCVACLGSTDCKDATKSVCNKTTFECVGCLASSDCSKDATKPVCDLAKTTCVGCLGNTDCSTATASRCDTATNTCTACQADSDCSQIAGKNVCSAGMCVQCTGKKHGACGELEGKALVCDSLSQTCTTDKKVGSSGLCQPCVSDAQCPAGQLCHQQMFDGKPVGYFCFWKEGDTANGAPAGCALPTNRPYAKAEPGVISIDGEAATLCTLRATTCTAYNQFSNLDCAPTGAPNDALCGFAPGVDSKCSLYSSSLNLYRCTTVCLGNDDCDVACNTGTSPKVCTFQ
ncbi:MAG: hypothetical protein QM784_30275 [Polyangiaceae bacterium]